MERQITNKLLDIDKTHHTDERKSLIKAGATEASEEYFGETKDREGIIAFVTELLDRDNPKIRKLAQGFMRK